MARATGTARRPHRTAANVAVTAFLAVIVGYVIFTGSAAAAYRFAAAEPVTVEIQYVGIACGSHLRWQTPRAGIPAGTRIRFVNTTSYWNIPIEITTANRADAPVVATSPVLSPGGEWEYVFWHRGEYFLRSAETMQQQAGLARWLTIN